MKFRVKQYEFMEYTLHDIAAQIRLLFNDVIKEPFSKWRNIENLFQISPLAYLLPC